MSGACSGLGLDTKNEYCEPGVCPGLPLGELLIQLCSKNIKISLCSSLFKKGTFMIPYMVTQLAIDDFLASATTITTSGVVASKIQVWDSLKAASISLSTAPPTFPH